MAGWIKYTKGLHEKLEIIQIADILHLPRHQVVGMCLHFWDWLDDNVQVVDVSETGDASVTLRALQPSFLDALVQADGFAAAMSAVGWLSHRNGSLTVPNYARHNGQTAKDRALTANRMAKSRSKKSDVSTVTRASPDKRREEKSNTPLPPSGDESEKFRSASVEVYNAIPNYPEVWSERLGKKIADLIKTVQDTSVAKSMLIDAIGKGKAKPADYALTVAVNQNARANTQPAAPVGQAVREDY